MAKKMTKYRQYTIETTVDAEDILSAVLNDTGIEGIEITDSKPWSKEELDEIFVDEVPLNPDIPQGVAYVSFYLSEEDDTRQILEDVRLALEDMKTWADVPYGSLEITSTEIKDEDYLNSWKQYFHSFDIELEGNIPCGKKHVYIIPSWEEDPDRITSDDTIVLHMDPGTAFGTGAHETTKLCIQALAKNVTKGTDILDLGTGSGILSIAALKFGASRLIGTDLDVNAIPAVKDNFEKNGLSDSDFHLVIGDVVTDESIRKEVGKDHDIVVANILPVVLIPLTSVMKELVRPGGLIIYSGILTEKAPDVIKALEDNGFTLKRKDILGEWCALTATL